MHGPNPNFPDPDLNSSLALKAHAPSIKNLQHLSTILPLPAIS